MKKTKKFLVKTSKGIKQFDTEEEADLYVDEIDKKGEPLFLGVDYPNSSSNFPPPKEYLFFVSDPPSLWRHEKSGNDNPITKVKDEEEAKEIAERQWEYLPYLGELDESWDQIILGINSNDKTR